MTSPAPPLSNDSLESLQNEDARKVMDTVDRLRKAGLGSIVQLPQIVTVGDQSSGKSSTLEAITGIPFPRKENLCTRFATQIVMRRAKAEGISVAIIPDKFRSQEEQEKLKALDLKLDDFSKLGDLMERATDAMGLNTPDQFQPHAFSRDVLSIEISGPTRPQLTLVDLPGLIHSETKYQSRDDVKLIQELVEDYIKEKRTIVLAVVSAKNDVANQIVLSKARDLGAGDRTLGIITKTDVLEPGTDNEKSWIELTQNKDVIFGLGWHMLRNRNPKEMEESLEYRDKTEKAFFSSGSFRSLDREMVGIETLRTRLSTLLYEHLTKELPLLQKELKEKHQETQQALDKLGHARATTEEQKQYLMVVGQEFEKIASAAVAGHYELEFLSKIDHKQPVMHKSNVVRLRAAVQHANLQFAGQMRQYGSKFRVVDGPPEFSEMEEKEKDSFTLAKYYKEAESFQLVQSHSEALKWVQEILERSRGRELPGNFNPAMIGQLFREQSQPWQQLAAAHVDKVVDLCTSFVEQLLRSITTEDVYNKVLQNIVQPELKARADRAHEELMEIVKDKNGDPITYNHYYTTTIQKMRAKMQERKVDALLREKGRQGTDFQGGPITSFPTQALVKMMSEVTTENDMDKFSAEDALICHMAYYKDELKFFVNSVTKHVIERHLVSDLPSKIISSVRFGLMSADDLRILAAEPSAVMQQREGLFKRQEMLKEGMKQFRFAVGNF
ncbi:P-loop containing nucleoside triphosphate hydrolase protein [Elsinoe ampelina]|uniref:P-loop containing nucleoside triphosphate hydrolase protein n=1 Tax=Elsinoe ampelina TaxID=302913 RepID=A0A6A6GNY5_9PEZI|nr:P-loop containing nucleoside triphosphate hydrolase protein [Elsinoe ampelina]